MLDDFRTGIPFAPRRSLRGFSLRPERENCRIRDSQVRMRFRASAPLPKQAWGSERGGLGLRGLGFQGFGVLGLEFRV